MKELQEFCENSDEFIPTDMVEIMRPTRPKILMVSFTVQLRIRLGWFKSPATPYKGDKRPKLTVDGGPPAHDKYQVLVLSCFIKDIKYDKECIPPTQILELELIDVTTDEDILIHELLLNENRAISELN
ncbi:hypothetical protein EVAR_68977_1 [Eumeta japonica]|uniref:Uncharacterized protein n=1 Tax=Eumeta variegata TaxID=151549 RepID=A0A4C1SLF0_EUMVA|nr:hypothetical protein EVAR_68977_1 [Eumeta japonica]